MREHILYAKSIFLEEFIFIERSEEFVFLDVRVSGIRFLGVNSGEVLSLKHIFEFESQVSKETRQVEVPSSGFIIIEMLENPESVDRMEDIISRVSFVNGLHLISMEVVPKVVSYYDRLVQCGVNSFSSRKIRAVSECENVGVFDMLQGVGVDKDLTLWIKFS